MFESGPHFSSPVGPGLWSPPVIIGHTLTDEVTGDSEQAPPHWSAWPLDTTASLAVRGNFPQLTPTFGPHDVKKLKAGEQLHVMLGYRSIIANEAWEKVDSQGNQIDRASRMGVWFRNAAFFFEMEE